MNITNIIDFQEALILLGFYEQECNATGMFTYPLPLDRDKYLPNILLIDEISDDPEPADENDVNKKPNGNPINTGSNEPKSEEQPGTVKPEDGHPNSTNPTDNSPQNADLPSINHNPKTAIKMDIDDQKDDQKKDDQKLVELNELIISLINIIKNSTIPNQTIPPNNYPGTHWSNINSHEPDENQFSTEHLPQEEIEHTIPSAEDLERQKLLFQQQMELFLFYLYTYEIELRGDLTRFPKILQTDEVANIEQLKTWAPL